MGSVQRSSHRGKRKQAVTEKPPRLPPLIGDMHVLANRRLRLYGEKHHNTAKARLPNGRVVLVDPPISGLIDDANRLDFVKTTTESCAGGKEEEVSKNEEKDSVFGEAYSWGSRFDIKYKKNPDSLKEAVCFEDELRGLMVKLSGDSGEIRGRVALTSGFEELPMRRLIELSGNKIEHDIVFDKPPTLEVLDIMWQAIHRLTRKFLADQREDRLRMYAKRYHNTAHACLRDGTVVSVDPPIAGLIEDLQGLDFIEATGDTCAGGKHRIISIEDSVFGRAYYPNSHFQFYYEKDPKSLGREKAFRRELYKIRVTIASDSGEITGRVAPSTLSRELPKRERERYYDLVFDKPPTIEALDTTWQEVHKVVKKHLAQQEKPKG